MQKNTSQAEPCQVSCNCTGLQEPPGGVAPLVTMPWQWSYEDTLRFKAYRGKVSTFVLTRTQKGELAFCITNVLCRHVFRHAGEALSQQAPGEMTHAVISQAPALLSPNDTCFCVERSTQHYLRKKKNENERVSLRFSCPQMFFTLTLQTCQIVYKQTVYC